MTRVYREARQGTLPTAEATRLIFMLTAIARLIESSDLEQRLEQVEVQLGNIHRSQHQKN
jgi:hypothetical protein